MLLRWVVATLLYGSETWTLQIRHIEVYRIQAAKMRSLRKEGVTRIARVPNADIRRRLVVEAVSG